MAGVTENDAEVYGVKDELDELETGLDNWSTMRPARVVYGQRFEEFDQDRREYADRLSDHIAEMNFEDIIDGVIENRPADLMRFYPDELRDRISERRDTISVEEFLDPDYSEDEVESEPSQDNDEILEEEVRKYRDGTIGSIVDYNEIKRNAAVVWAKEYPELWRVQGDMLRDQFENF